MKLPAGCGQYIDLLSSHLHHAKGSSRHQSKGRRLEAMCALDEKR